MYELTVALLAVFNTSNGEAERSASGRAQLNSHCLVAELMTGQDTSSTVLSATCSSPGAGSRTRAVSTAGLGRDRRNTDRGAGRKLLRGLRMRGHNRRGANRRRGRGDGGRASGAHRRTGRAAGRGTRGRSDGGLDRRRGSSRGLGRRRSNNGGGSSYGRRGSGGGSDGGGSNRGGSRGSTSLEELKALRTTALLVLG